MTRALPVAALLILGSVSGLAGQTARADLIDLNGNRTGEVLLTQTPHHGVLLRITAWGLEPGVRGIHIHETGRCDPPDFESAGGHFNPTGSGHGALHPTGMHVGDLLNLHVPAEGRVETERHAFRATLARGEPASLVGGNGTAIVIHESPDDYRTQPTGAAGGRVACGVIQLIEAKP
jgi:superoxide dismutase, Cu-Zn family